MADYTVTLDSTPEYVVTQEKTVVAEFLSELSDVNVPDLSNKGNHVLIYNATAQKYELVPADSILSAAASDNVLPNDFIDQLDQDLDNKIDFDGGSF
tara:strand:+ start:4674 stop:4964 length:291 start_codon:yes stop_codon:yes gene_type:complete